MMHSRRNILNQVREVHDGTPDFMAYVNSMTSLSSRIGTEVFILVVAVVMIVVGATEHKGCPANSTLPFYLIVTGVLYLLWLTEEEVFSICENECAKFVGGILNIVLTTGLFIAGNVWVYGVWDNVKTGNQFAGEEDYCSPWVYWLSFAQISVFTIILLVGILTLLVWALFVCCIKCCCVGGVEDNEQTPLQSA